jgi:hypothetical protein
MWIRQSGSRPLWRTLLVLGRTSNLPTVWSNCLAGWLLAGGGSWGRFAWLCLGATLLYVSGMFLNDAFDATFDRQHRRERPIPSGAISEGAVWIWGLSLMGAGLLCLLWLGNTVAVLAMLLALCIVLYDAVHKMLTLAPVLMAGCRFLLYVLAGAAAAGALDGWTVWGGLALGLYVVGLSFIARKESTRGPLHFWPALLLAAPVLLALLMNAGPLRSAALFLSVLLAIWVLRCLQFTFFNAERNVGRTVSGLLGGIVLVDLLIVLPPLFPFGLIFLALFGAALLAQRFIPAT